MMTLHGLVMISELFAGFNLINTGVVNCLVMCKMHHTEAKKILGGAQPLSHWGGDTTSPNPTLFLPL